MVKQNRRMDRTSSKDRWITRTSSKNRRMDQTSSKNRRMDQTSSKDRRMEAYQFQGADDRMERVHVASALSSLRKPLPSLRSPHPAKTRPQLRISSSTDLQRGTLA
eukprot:467463-Prorocentrum_minimum.AAC.2